VVNELLDGNGLLSPVVARGQMKRPSTPRITGALTAPTNTGPPDREDVRQIRQTRLGADPNSTLSAGFTGKGPFGRHQLVAGTVRLRVATAGADPTGAITLAAGIKASFLAVADLAGQIIAKTTSRPTRYVLRGGAGGLLSFVILHRRGGKETGFPKLQTTTPADLGWQPRRGNIQRHVADHLSWRSPAGDKSQAASILRRTRRHS